MNARQAKHFYEFGPFRIVVSERLLLRDGEAVPLTPKAFDTLMVLVENAGRLVEKEEFMRRLWPDTFVEEANLAHNISLLRKAFGESADGNKYIQTVPRRGYRLLAGVKETREESGPLHQSEQAIIQQSESEMRGHQSRDEQPAAMSAAVAAARSRPRLRAASIKIVATVVLIAAAVTVVFLLLRAKASLPPLRVVPFTSYQGNERQPAFSPDGNYIAFTWEGERGDNADIYVKLVDGGTPLRLTTDAARDISPTWSPDGHRVAFLRKSDEANAIYETTLTGGPERKLADFRPGMSFVAGKNLDWSPDGRTLAVAECPKSSAQQALFLISIETGEERQLTTPDADDAGDVEPAFSPDGRQIAFVRVSHLGVREIFIVAVAGGETRRVTFDNQSVLGLDWTADGREIVFSSNRSDGNFNLWRIPIAGGEPAPLAGTGNRVSGLSVSHRRNSLAYTQRFMDTNIYRVEVPDSSMQSGPPVPLIASTQWDSTEQYSPDGKSIVFGSDRSGSYEIWTCAGDGSNALQLTSFGGPHTGTPRWSFDGKYIAFDSRPGGKADIFIIKATGGQPRRLTEESSDDVTPNWSPDGRWVYFSSNRSGDWQIWKVPAEGGEAVQMTRQGGFGPTPSPDGKFVYFAKTYEERSSLWRIVADGSREEAVPGFDRQTWWVCVAVTEVGIYFVNTTSPQRQSIEFFDFKTGQYKTIAANEKNVGPGLSVSPDGRWILYTQYDQDNSDVMIAENFR